MADQEKPLPKPPTSAFGRRKPSPDQENQELIADRMAEAAARGGLEEFLERELPDSEHARSLARMMMGMTGMMPPSPSMATPTAEAASTSPVADANVPEDVRQAVLSGEVRNVMDMLRREHERRSGGAETGADQPTPTEAAPSIPLEEKALIDALMHIASENHVTVDWIIMRALKLYLVEFRKTGRL
jgi:hypothetical protein